MDDPKQRKSSARAVEGWRSVAVFSGAGITLAAAVAIGACAGSWLDHRLGTEPWLLIVGFLLGTIAGFMELLRMVALVGRK